MRISDLAGLFGRRPQRRSNTESQRIAQASPGTEERFPRLPRVVRWAWASAVTTGIVMTLANGQSVSRAEVLQLLKAVTALVEEEAPARAKDQPAPPELQGPPIYIPDPKWGR